MSFIDEWKIKLKHERRAQSYYESPEYRSRVEELQEVLSKVKDKVIAVDLEGTLVSRNMYVTHDVLSERRFRPKDGFRIRRPLSNEIMEILNRQNQVGIWTGVDLTTYQRIVKNTGMKIPEQVKVITGEDFLDERMVNMMGLRRPLKLASKFGFDIIIDDHPIYPDQIARFNVGADAEKIVVVRRFEIGNEAELVNYEKDVGLIEAAVELRRRTGFGS